jgi:serine/threonine-protein kinase
MAQLMYKIANEHAPDILKYNPSLPPAFVAFLDKAMSKEVEARYQTGEEFAAALRSVFGTTATGATSAGVDISL